MNKNNMNVRVMLMVVCFLGSMSVVFGNQQTLGEDGAQKIREKLKEPLLRLLSSSEFAPIADVKKRWSDAKVAIDAFEKDLDVLMAQKAGPKVEAQQAPATVASVPVVQPKEEIKSATKEEIQKELAGKEKEITEEIKALQPTLKAEEIAEQQAQAPVVESAQAPVVEAPVVEKPAEAVSAPAVPVETVPVETVPVETVPVETVPAAVVPAEAAPVTTVPGVAPAPEMPAPAVAPEIIPPAPEQVPVVTPEQAAMPLPEATGPVAVPEGAQ